MISFEALTLAAAVALLASPQNGRETRLAAPPHTDERRTVVRVSGSGLDHLDTALVHSQEATAAGMIQKSTETVELSGDLKGRILYHVTSVFDYAAGTLVNTGDQVFSGTIAESSPVLLHDDQFRFQVNLTTGAERGQVYLIDHIAGPRVRCELDVMGTGLTAEGNPTFDYNGTCTFRGPSTR
jgi:hypothetical protein